MIKSQTAAGLLVDDADRFLLGLRAANKKVASLHWDMIGGHLEPGEDARQALDRELEEELAIQVIEAKLVGQIHQRDKIDDWFVLHHVFAVTAWLGTPVNNCDEHSEIRWFYFNEITRLPNRTPFSLNFFRLALEQRNE